MKLDTLKLMNKVKNTEGPKALQICNITSIYKDKGPRKYFDSYRGIFHVTFLKSILDRLIYNDINETGDSNLSDCNVGNRKGRNIRDHIFVLNAILKSIKRKTEEAVDIGVYDVKKCLDTLLANKALNDAYELALKNDKFLLVYMSNKHASIAITSSIGTSTQINIYNTIMQGTVWMGVLSTGTMEKLQQRPPSIQVQGKNCYASIRDG